MERIDGPTLRARMSGRRLPASELAPIVEAVAAGLRVVHGHGVIHGDLKPETVFVLDDAVKVVDFGSCKVHGLERLTATGETIGTPVYMAPELLTGAAPIDEGIDVYALGVILFEALAGALPFDDRHPGKLVFAITSSEVPRLDAEHGIAPAVSEVVHRALDRDRARRYADVVSLANAFAAAANERGGVS
jgi:serine/threonine-protein kinase